MRYQIQNEKLRVEVLSHGAELCSLRKNGTEYLWQGDEATWRDQSPNLFPYTGRMPEKKYRYRGQEYSMDIHGFAKDLEFVCQRIREDYLLCYLEDSQETRAIYPFAFRFEVHYELEGNTLRVYYIVKNKEGKTLYFGLGGHPGFRVPLGEQEKFEDYYIQFSPEAKPEIMGINNRGFVEWEPKEYPLEMGNRLSLRHNLFDEDAIFLRNTAGRVQLCGLAGAVVEVRYPKMTYLGLWQWPRVDVPYLCIEPWVSVPSREGVTEDLETKPDLVGLAGYATYTNRWEIELL